MGVQRAKGFLQPAGRARQQSALQKEEDAIRQPSKETHSLQLTREAELGEGQYTFLKDARGTELPL